MTGINLKQFIALLVFFVSLSYFFVGIHNIDNAYNLKYVNSIGYEDVRDANLFGHSLEADEIYSLGVMYCFVSIWLLFLSSFFLGLFNRKEVEK